MAVFIGSARSNERGGVTGGAAGDQKNGAEVSAQNWYKHSKGWIVIRPKKADAAEKIAKTMEAACANNFIGYCQDHRNDLLVASRPYGYDVSQVKKPTEVDCSALIRVCCLAAGINVGDFYTGNELSTLIATGAFDAFDDAEICDSSDLLKRGDILVTITKGHTVVVLNDGAKIQKYGWIEDKYGWWYAHEDGTWTKNGWELIGGFWYYFNTDGYMVTGWQQIGGEWYYFDTTAGSTQGQLWHEAPGGKGNLEPWHVE